MINKLLALVVLSLFSLTGHALPQDREEPIRISADSASIDEKSGMTVYRGDVKITQGSLLIEADRVELKRGKQGVSQVTAHGKPAHFRQRPASDKPFTDAWGETIIYKVDKEHLTLKSNAKVISGKDSFTGNRILYDLQSSVVDAFSDSTAEKPARVEMVIQPKVSKPQPKADVTPSETEPSDAEQPETKPSDSEPSDTKPADTEATGTEPTDKDAQ